MPERKMPAYIDPLDLLRRFVPTPLKAVYQFGAVRVIVQTNDFSLLPTASSVANLPGISERAACLLGLDQERRELLAFIGSDVHVRTHQEFLVPLFCRLTNEAVLSGPLSDFARSQEEYCR